MRTSRTNRKAAKPKLAYSPVARGPRIPLQAELPLREHAERALADYFANLNGHRPARLYNLVLREVEEPLFRTVLDHAGGNQSQAAIILGITRATLRKKLREFGLSA
ncbi:MAG TPA: helix-turn-helix domain-containing protein [Steroidobacteraceae bacterium]|nr:helix-turn-helix domain-containing protein [Steroidobacteraceae bacterium]